MKVFVNTRNGHSLNKPLSSDGVVAQFHDPVDFSRAVTSENQEDLNNIKRIVKFLVSSRRSNRKEHRR